MDNKTRVNILGREYVLKGELDPQYIEKLSEKLNQRITEVKESSEKDIDDLQAVILVSLNLLDEIEIHTSDQNILSEDDAIKKTNRLISMLEKGIIGEDSF